MAAGSIAAGEVSMPMDPLDLARRLIDIPSPSGAEGELGRYLIPVLERIGLSVSLQPVGPDRFNLLGVARGGEPAVVLCTHIDVVPPHIPSREDETWIHGRGACDTKGILAAMLAASERLVGEGTGGFALLLVVAEETDSIGARSANDWQPWRSRFVVVGEPTGSRFARGQKGAFKADLLVRGRAAHSAYAERGESALLKLLPILDDLNRADWGEDPVLGRGSLNVGELHAGVRANVVPEAARASLMIRVVDSVAETERRLREVVGERAEIEAGLANEPQEIFVPDGSEGVVVGFNTDIPFLPRLGRPILLGPGSILDAHSPGEKIRKDDLLAAVETYRELVLELCSGGGGSRSGPVS
jgi:acetylornithine deacetylase